MPNHSLARQLFNQSIRTPEAQLSLAEVAMLIAWEDQGGDDPRPLLQQLDQFAQDIRPRIAGAHTPYEQIAVLNRYLFDEQGFYGDPRCYEHPDPANSYLNRVLQRRCGLPILLSLIYLEVGWRLGLPLVGLALPGHFLVRYISDTQALYVDPFSGGAIWSHADCERQIATFYGETTQEIRSVIFVPPTKRAILARILRNLKQTYLTRDDVTRALYAVERLLRLDSSDPGELRDRGLLRFRAGYIYPALEDLERYVQHNPSASDLNQLRSFAKELISRVAPAN